MDKRIILIFALFGLLLAATMFNTTALFSSTHTVYKNKTTAFDFCIKCHSDKVEYVDASVHRNAGCICHGYNPNSSDIYNINVAHNLSKQIYCTNCHSNYSIATGNIIIHNDASLGDISGINQSPHYLIKSSTNKTPVYDRARQFYNGS